MAKKTVRIRPIITSKALLHVYENQTTSIRSERRAEKCMSDYQLCPEYHHGPEVNFHYP